MARKKLKGTIKRIGSNNTISVEVVRVFHHPTYRKRIQSSKVYLAHSEREGLEVGQSVVIEESRPISKRKRWLILGEKESRSEAVKESRVRSPRRADK